MALLASVLRSWRWALVLAALAGLSIPVVADDGGGESPQAARMLLAVSVDDLSADAIAAVGGDVFGRDGGDLHVLATAETREALEQRGVPFAVIHQDIDRAYADYRAGLKQRYGENFQDYHSYAATIQIMERIAGQYPDLAALEVIGQSVEGRPIHALRISDHAADIDPDRPAILLTGCHHAREWISVEVPLFYADYLTENFHKVGDVTRLLRFAEIWIVPILNPDGYLYTWNSDRWWRKNRKSMQAPRIDWRTGEPVVDPDTGQPIIETVYGIDINRNYGFKWGLDSGSSGIPQTEVYRGPEAFSEPETRAIRDLMNGTTFAGRMFKSVITYHNYSQLILYPNGYTTAPVKNYQRYQFLTEEMARLINHAHSSPDHDYAAGQGSVILYSTSGDLTDWAHHATGAIALTIELRPSGYPWFELPPDEIIPTCQENLPAMLYFAHETLIPDAKPADGDNDGYLEDEDYCPESPTAVVDATGCDGSEQDLDKDGVLNAVDGCKHTPRGQMVGVDGCRLEPAVTFLLTTNVPGAGVANEPADIDGLSRRTLEAGPTTVDFAAPGLMILAASQVFGANTFSHWVVDGQPQAAGQFKIVVDGRQDVRAEAIYVHPKGLRIVGPSQIPDVDASGLPRLTPFIAEVVFSDDTARPIAGGEATWTSSDPNLAAISAEGELLASGIDADAGRIAVELGAKVNYLGVDLVSDPFEVTIFDAASYAPACAELSIEGPAAVPSNGEASFSARLLIEGALSSEPTTRVTWSVAAAAVEGSSSAEGDVPAAISDGGALTADWVAEQTPLVVTARYVADDGTSCTAERAVSLLAGDPADRPAGRVSPVDACGALGWIPGFGLLLGFALYALRAIREA